MDQVKELALLGSRERVFQAEGTVTADAPKARESGGLKEQCRGQ